ncbi:MAG: dihydrolipoyl dehydrogenase [Rhodanobacteraceae bacterium]|mgnify:CR=1 FL=1|nr:dihydrolipoyl dehydrogenase [Rhodanobacteraceae bacterium]MBP9154359.1 dihydrolipoyl dehydrogenase [Xanthomonadales bacterium]HQW80705.1 dihydrolipoyl dehydrogenase [Pseudomonadota bacterium]
MTNMMEVKVPDLGGSSEVPVIELLVNVGDTVKKDQGLVTLESDKATMEVPSSVAGIVRELRVKLGDKLSEGALVAIIENAAPAPAPAPAPTPTPTPTAPTAAPAPAPTGGKADIECQIVVIGAGPGGYSAAFRAADLDQNVVLIERYAELGGVCLNVGCIPSKALLHAAKVIDEASHAADYGISFGTPKIDLGQLRTYKEKVVKTLNAGLSGMAKQRKVTRLQGLAKFVSANEIEVATADGSTLVRFEKAIIAAGSQPVKLPGLGWDDPRVMDSTDALQLVAIPKRLLVIGGGIIGLEMACVFDALGSEVTVVELADQLMPGADIDLVKPLQTRLAKRYAGIHLKTKVSAIDAKKDGLHAHFEGASIPKTSIFDRVLCAVGRTPNGNKLNAEAAGVAVDARGFIAVDKQMRTNIPHIFAIGDIVGQPMLAHKATHEARVAAENASGLKREFVARVIPSVAYTDPEIAWVGLTETEAKAKGIAYAKGVFPWAASGRAIGIGRTEGFTKMLYDEGTHRVIGVGIVGPHAGDLISEAALAIEMQAEIADVGLTIHPHPTLGETIGLAAEVCEGTVTDLYLPKRQ